jgi:multiple sugar transport system ATP-binding protein
VINNGVVQQLARPQDLYHHPANVFVAAFIGSPSMNLFEAHIQEGDLAFAGVRLPLPPDRDLGAYDGKTVVVGVRPADFEDAALMRDASRPTLDIVCDVTEELGDEMNVIFTLDAQPVVTDATRAVRDEISEVEATRLGEEVLPAATVCTARLSAHDTCRPGEKARLAIDTSALHFFDRESGEAIGVPKVAGPGGPGQ